ATLLTALATQSGSIVPHEVYDDPGKKYLQHPVGCGPFSFESWEHGRDIRMAAFHDHWKGPPGIAGIDVRIIPDVTTALLEYRTGGLEIDNEVPSGQRRKVSEEMGSQYRVRPRISTSYILLNQATGPFSESRDLRLAVNYAVDRDRIAKVLQEGKDQASSWILPPDLAGGRTTPGPYGYDPETAKKLLAGAGFPGGKGLPPLTLLSPDNESIRRYAESVQNDLREIGLNVKLEALDFNAYYEALFGSPGKGPKADMAVLIWFADYPDPEAVLRQLFRSDSAMNFGRYHNDEVDRLLDEADAETNPSRRQEIFLSAEKVLLDDGAIVPLHHQGDDLLVKPYVTGIVQSPLGDFAVPLELAGMSR
ncbi:MAG TPA: ABC transporter substrate-binding protein, partial [Candidatus Saccharimonadales bacterium]|nr:ABC transporter substrate-binding protein [Candidatus Saccharimonadales bacterium]